MTPALGTQCKGTNRRPIKWGRRVVVSFDDDLFAAIRQYALDNRTTFSEAVRTLCQWGLEDGG